MWDRTCRPSRFIGQQARHDIFVIHTASMNFNNVPWGIGEDIQAPTCATCHISLTVNRTAR
jgi:hydroxylamine dehydrogenase